MKSTTRAKPKIFYTGAPSGQGFNTLKDVGEVSVENDKDHLEHAEVLWVDCTTTKPEDYGPLLKTALDAGKTLVMKHPDALAQDALSRIVGSRLTDNGASLILSRDPRATTPSSYAVTVIDEAPPPLSSEQSQSKGDGTSAATVGALLDVSQAPPDWTKLLETHRERTALAVGGPGLIPPTGVMYVIRTLAFSRSDNVSIRNWPATQGKSQTLGMGFTSSFYVYRDNGKSDAAYVVIRVQQAFSSPGSLMVNTNEARGLWHFELTTQGYHRQGGTPLLGTSPATTNGPSIITHLSIPLHVKYLQDGGCLANYWFATHGPVVRNTEGWGLANQSTIGASFLGSGGATWSHFHRAPWNSLEDPTQEFERWRSTRFEGIPSRVKNLNALAGSTFTFENLAAWRFSASDIAADPNVTFCEDLSYRFAAFATGARTGSNTGSNQIHVVTMASGLKSITLNLPEITDDGTSPCR